MRIHRMKVGQLVGRCKRQNARLRDVTARRFPQSGNRRLKAKGGENEGSRLKLKAEVKTEWKKVLNLELRKSRKRHALRAGRKRGERGGCDLV
jgi:hypothetical protein